MDLALSEEQSLLARAAREFLEREAPLTLVRAMEEDPTGFPAALWKQMADLGWFGLALPSAVGGSDGDFVDLCVLLVELGRALVPGPFLPCVVPAASTIARAGSEEQRRTLVPAIIRGERIVTWAGQEPAARYDPTVIETTVREEGEELILNGVKLFVAYPHIATDLLVVARDRGGLSLLLVDAAAPGIERTRLNVVDRGQQYEVVFREVRVPATATIGPRGGAAEIIRLALAEWTVATCAFMVGGMERAFEMAVDYSKTRVQFGRPIGSFQALQHKAANMLVDVEGARLVTFQAAYLLFHEPPADREVSIAKAWTSEAYRRVCTEAHQMHGAIGFTWEYDLQLFTRRMRVLEGALGDADYHRRQVAAALGL
ncbi:MAG: acyl-CoA dehydrogenase family protein [Chloroflexota bacterium]|nr:acyl-CoA/acyl-ACP dehydrogenase [Dehalococcoidia bacterium]MDW8253495.1 acyl-CoA dehydrogenase family protein [Chloroflexota bacterium]